MVKNNLTTILASIVLGLNIGGGVEVKGNDIYELGSYTEKRAFYFGDNKVNVTKILIEGKNKTTYVNVHENEWTSITEGKNDIKKNGGILFLFNHRKTRKIDATRCNFDPNRIYTGVGIFHSVAKKDRKTVELFSNNYLDWVFKDTNSIIALHNNTNQGYSIISYLKPKGRYSKDATRSHRSYNRDPDDFFFTTNNYLYEYLVKKDYNVVLQSPGARDDGSLSIYAERNKIDYINVEAQFGHSKTQAKMIAVATGALNILEKNIGFK